MLPRLVFRIKILFVNMMLDDDRFFGYRAFKINLKFICFLFAFNESLTADEVLSLM